MAAVRDGCRVELNLGWACVAAQALGRERAAENQVTLHQMLKAQSELGLSIGVGALGYQDLGAHVVGQGVSHGLAERTHLALGVVNVPVFVGLVHVREDAGQCTLGVIVDLGVILELHG